MVESINSQANSNIQENTFFTTQQAEKKEKVTRDSLSTPTENVSKTAQTSSDIVVSSGKNLNQIVIENSNGVSIKDQDLSAETFRNLKVSSTESVLGTRSDNNALPAEINSKGL